MNIPDISTRMQVHNHFIAVVKDGTTGKLKQQATAYNVVLDQFYTNEYASAANNFNFVQIGTGTGQPRASDTSLFSRKYTFSAQHTRQIISADTLQVTTVVTSPVGNIGDFTEVGFGNSSYLMSHALFTDAENNPIVIRQTSTDLLEITAVAFINLNLMENIFKYATTRAAIMDSMFSGSNSIIPSKLGIGLATAIAGDIDNITNGFFSMHGAYIGLGNSSGEYLGGWPLRNNEITRMSVSQGNYGFYNYLAMGISAGGSNYTQAYPSSFVKFPNYSVFPLYTIENMAVGVGDGINSNFNCPIDMFVKDSDVIRVNGVPLVRDVDYTIDHHSNHNLNISATPGCIAKCKADIPRLTSNLTRYRMFAPSISYYSLEPYDAFTHNNPLYIELDDTDETIGTTLNYISLSGLRPLSNSNNDSMNGMVYKLEYSIDGNSYNVATTLTFEGNLSSKVEAQFQSITAKYWRLSIDVTNSRYYTAGSITKDTPIVQYVAASTVLGYRGTGITFINPPANGAVIEMDVSIDRPYKSSDFVIELASSISVSR